MLGLLECWINDSQLAHLNREEEPDRRSVFIYKLAGGGMCLCCDDWHHDPGMSFVGLLEGHKGYSSEVCLCHGHRLLYVMCRFSVDVTPS